MGKFSEISRSCISKKLLGQLCSLFVGCILTCSLQFFIYYIQSSHRLFNIMAKLQGTASKYGVVHIKMRQHSLMPLRSQITPKLSALLTCYSHYHNNGSLCIFCIWHYCMSICGSGGWQLRLGTRSRSHRLPHKHSEC